MFVDEVNIIVSGGDGGPGALSFHREKYLPKGGPDGGDGGKGGDVYITGDRDLETLNFYLSKKRLSAGSGSQGQGNRKSGKDGEDLYLRVPLGTCVYNSENGRFLGEVLFQDDKILVAKGGRGGRGNSNFLSNKYRAPRVAERGETGEKAKITLVLKSIVDVAILGFPNSGKSTLLSLITNAHPKVGDYPFTTTEPVFGVLSDKVRPVKFVEIPAIVDGSHKGLGLGNKFLRHAERASVLLIMFNEEKEIEIVRNELSYYSEDLLKKSTVTFSKNDLFIENKIEELKEEILKLLDYSKEVFSSKEDKQSDVELQPLYIEKIENTFYVSSNDLIRAIRRIDFRQRDYHLLLNPLIRKFGLLDALKNSGAKDGDKVIIGGIPFTMLEGRIRCEL